MQTEEGCNITIGNIFEIYLIRVCSENMALSFKDFFDQFSSAVLNRAIMDGALIRQIPHKLYQTVLKNESQATIFRAHFKPMKMTAIYIPESSRHTGSARLNFGELPHHGSVFGGYLLKIYRELPDFSLRSVSITICAALIFGCVFPPQQTVKQSDSPRDSIRTLTPENVESDQKLIKPRIPSEAESDDQDRHLPPLKPLATEQASGAAEPVAANPTRPEMQAPEQKASPTYPVVPEPLKQASAMSPEAKPQPSAVQKESASPSFPKPAETEPRLSRGDKSGREWEDQKVRSASYELAKSYSGVKKIKVCYSVKDDEWWVTLYDFTGSFIDLKQFTWNRDLDKLESFLVVNKIPLSRMQSHLSEDQPGKACEVMDTLNAESESNPVSTEK